MTVYLRAGVYTLTAPFVLQPEDSGAPGAPVTYAAYEGEMPILSGGVRLRGWRPLYPEPSDVAETARGRLWVSDVPKGTRFNQLFLNGVRLQRSATPNGNRWEDWYKAIGGEGKSVLYVPPTAIQSWSDLDSIEVNVLAGSRYSNSILQVKALSPENGRMELVAGGPYPIRSGDPFRIENAIAGIDVPGEWSIDAKAGRVYLLPPEGVNLTIAEVIAPVLSVAIVLAGREESGQLVRFVNFRGIGVRHVDRLRVDDPTPPGGHGGLDTNAAAVLLRGVEDCSIERCSIALVGGIGIRAILHAERLRLVGNEIIDCGGHGISVRGYGPGTLQVNREHEIADNVVRRCGQIYWHGSGIDVSMAGNLVVRGNRVQEMPYAGLSVIGQRAVYFRASKGKQDTSGFGFRWSEIGDDPLTIDSVKRFIPGRVRVEDNVIEDVMQTLDDGGGIYLWGSHHNVVRGNRVLRCRRDYSHGVYLDNEEMDTLVEGNVVSACPASVDTAKGSALLLHENGRNIIRANVFAGPNRLFRFPGSYGGHRITNNIFLFGDRPASGEDPKPRGDYEAGPSIMDDNLYWSTAGAGPARSFLGQWQRAGWDSRSVVADPLFVDPASGDFRVKPGSPAVRLGFKPISGD